jgi:hypothetical protein
MEGLLQQSTTGRDIYSNLQEAKAGIGSAGAGGMRAYASVFDRPERTTGARGGCGSAHASSRSPLWRRGDHRQPGGGASAGDGRRGRFAGAQTYPRLSTAHWEGPGGDRSYWHGFRHSLMPPSWSTAPGGRSTAPGGRSTAPGGRSTTAKSSAKSSAKQRCGMVWRAIRRRGWTSNKKHWQPVTATRRRARPAGARQAPTPHSTPRSSSLATKAARPSP